MFKKIKESINCKYCGSEHTVCCGMNYGKQRYKCKDCGKSFCENDERVKHDYKERQFVFLLYTNNMSLSSIQRAYEGFFNKKISFNLITKWVHSMVKILKNDLKEEKKNKKPKTIEVLEIDELYSYLYDLKKNKRFMSKYGLLWVEKKIKLLRLE